jgi:hypothetical protein
MDSDLVVALRSRGIPVITAWEAGLREKPDEEQLAFASETGCVLYTFNVSDFYRLHTQWLNAGREHAGVILVRQQRFRLASSCAAFCVFERARGACENQAEFLSNWG